MAVGAALLHSGCSDDLLTDVDPYQGEWLLPLVKSDITLDEIAQVDHFESEAVVSGDELGLPSGTPVPVPEFTLPLIGPYPLAVAPYIHEVRAQLSLLELQVTNGLPITLNSGTQFELRSTPDAADPTNLLVAVTMVEDLQPGGVFQTSITNTMITFFDSMYVYLRNVGSPGGPAVDATGAELGIALSIDLGTLELIRIHTNAQWDARDTFQLDLSGELDDNTDAAAGQLVIHAENGLPIKGSIQLYLYDAMGMLVDSLFNEPFVLEGGETDEMGHTTWVSAVSDTVTVNAARLEAWRDGRSATFVVKANTNGYDGAFVSADASAKLHLQVVGDMRLNVSYTSFE
jgi:hypothetical protein